MAFTLADAVVYFRGDDKKLVSDLGAAEQKTQSSSNNMAKWLGGAVVGAAAAAGAAIVGIGIEGFDAFSEFQGKMNEVFTLLPGISQKGMGDMTNQVKAFAKEFGVLPDKVVPALYQALSSGIPPDNVFEFLKASQKAAVGGATDLTVAVDGISSVVNAYGSKIIDATKASDLMFTAVKLGKTNFAELSASLFNVIPTAASLGVKFGDVTAALAAMTVQGTPTSVATTQLRQMFVELSQASSKAAKTFTDMSGKTFADFIAGGGNVQDALKLMEGAAQKSNVRLSDLFSSVEAGQAALALTGQGAQTFSTDIAAMQGAAGATDTAFNTMQSGVGKSIDKLKAAWAVGLLNLGEKLSPFVANLVNTASPIIISVLDGIGTNLDKLVVLWDSDWAHMRTTTTSFTNDLPGQLKIFWDSVNAIFKVGGDGIQTNWDLLWGYNLFSALTGFVTLAIAEATEFTRAINGIFTAFYSLFHGDWAGFWAGLEETANAVMDDMLNAIEYIFGPGVRDKLVGALTWAWDGMKDIWKDIADWWNGTIGALTGVHANVPSAASLAVVNPANTSHDLRQALTPIYAPGSAPAGATNSRTINVHPGAIVVNESKQGKETAYDILRILEGLAGAP